AQQEQMQKDAAALSLAYQHLRPTGNAPAVVIDNLKRAIGEASPGVKVQIFYQAERVRADHWQNEKPIMERTIPVFEALVESDPEGRFHRNFGQLGYALKDSQQPRWREAEAALTRAIKIRGTWQEWGWVLYEFNRAVCRINLDEQFVAGRDSAPDVRGRIVEDLRAVFASQVKNLLN